MKAIVYNEYGGPEVLGTTNLENPILSESSAIVRIHSISLNPRDSSLRKGEFRFLTGSKFPKLTGADFSGSIEDVRVNDRALKKGDEVFGYIQDLNAGASAELASIPIKFLVKKPPTISHGQASTLGCAYLTALQSLREKIKIKKNERVLIYGAAGGVGTAAIQLARHFGAYVIAVSHSSHREYCLEQGAHNFLAYNEQDIFSSERVDAFFQVYSKQGAVYKRAKLLLNRDGRFVCLIPNPVYLFHKLFSKPSFDYMLVKSNVKDLELLVDLAERKIINPKITKSFDMDDARDAFTYFENGRVQGKVVMNVAVRSEATRHFN